jgi:hypothetical protein
MRTTHVLSGNWHVKRLGSDRPDIARLTQEAAAPDGSWLAAPHFPAASANTNATALGACLGTP